MNGTNPLEHRLSSPYFLAACCVIAAILVMVIGQHIDRQRLRAVDRLASRIVSIAADRLDPAHDGRLVHVTGNVTGSAPIVDPDTGFQADGLRLIRQVEMFQWQRVTTAAGAAIAGRWLGIGYPSVLLTIDGKADGRSNPPMPLLSRTIDAPGMLIGGLPLGPALAERMPAFVSQRVSAEALPALAAKLGRNDLRVADGRIVSAAAPDSPAVGDLSISYVMRTAGPTPVSLLARQQGERLVAVPADIAGTFPVTVANGAHDLGFFTAQARAAVGGEWGWAMRWLGLGLIAIGCCVVIYWGQDLTGWDNEIGGVILMIPAVLVAAPVWGLAMLAAHLMGRAWWSLALGLVACLVAAIWLTLRWLDRPPRQKA